MLISEKNDGVDNFFFYFPSKEAYPLVRQLEKYNDKKSARESSKMREK